MCGQTPLGPAGHARTVALAFVTLVLLGVTSAVLFVVWSLAIWAAGLL